MTAVACRRDRSGLRTALATAVDRVRAQPRVFRTLWPLRERPHFNRRVVRRGDDLVIEGFPRSANSFVLAIFRVSQDPDLKIANHFHSPAQFVLARRYGVPAVLLIRDPRDSVLSMMIYEDTTDPVPPLRRYRRFHAPLTALASDLVVVDFATATTAAGRIVEALNTRHCAGLRPIEQDADLTERSRAWLRAHDAERSRRAGVEVGGRRVGLPNAERDARKSGLRARLDDPGVAVEVEAARAAYESLRAFAI